MPISGSSYEENLKIGMEVYHNLKTILEKGGYNTAVGDEGGFAPDLKDAKEVFEVLTEAVKKAGYSTYKDVVFAMDAAASELYNYESGLYVFKGEGNGANPINRNTNEMIAYYESLVDEYPLVSIEDGLDENDWNGWKELTKRLGDKVQLVGDDLFVTNPKRLKEGIEKKAANAILIKVNQIGTLSEAMEAIELAKNSGYKTIISHRSGETEDTFIADLAVAVNAGQIKTGAPCRGERTAKYNRLLVIEKETL
jgi:enolase